MKFIGQFHNTRFTHEGFTVDEYDDRTVVLHFFSYINGQQLWLIAVGKRIGSTAILNAFKPVGGHMGDPDALKTVKEEPWGTITLKEDINGLTVYFNSLDGVFTHNYTVTPVYSVVPPIATATSVPVEPTVTPIVTPIVATTKIVAERKVLGGPWRTSVVSETNPMYFYGTVGRNDEIVGGTWLQGKITVVEGELTITRTDVGGLYNPKITGLVKNQVIRAGETVNFSLSCDKVPGALPGTDGGSWTLVNWEIFTKELGQICKSSLQVIS